MDEKDFVPFETAKKLKAAGFDYPCYWYYTSENAPAGCHWVAYTGMLPTKNTTENSNYSKPELYQAQKWLREVKGIAVNVIAHDGGKYDYDIVFLPNSADYGGLLNRSPWCSTYEEALSEGIDDALELIKNTTK